MVGSGDAGSNEIWAFKTKPPGSRKDGRIDKGVQVLHRMKYSSCFQLIHLQMFIRLDAQQND